MNFWIIAVVLLIVSAAAVSWPLFAGSAKDRIISVLILLMIPAAVLVSYQIIGTPEALSLPAAMPQQSAQTQQPHSATGDNVDAMLAQLQQRMAENPEDPEGWRTLGDHLLRHDRAPEAVKAYERCLELAPRHLAAMNNLVEALRAADREKEAAKWSRLLEILKREWSAR